MPPPVEPLSFPDGLPFRKMHGSGNDFVVIDARERPVLLSQGQIARIADRRLGIGCDQLILLETSARAEARMRIFNPDGGEVEACGNATRCIAALLARESGTRLVQLETVAGLLSGGIEGAEVAVDMGLPVLDWARIPLAGEGGDTRRVPIDVSALSPHLPGWFSAVNMGNPHAVFFVADAGAIELGRLGPALETHPLFPEKANISFAEIRADGEITLRVWERAAGATLACGTAACASAVAALRLGLAGPVTRLHLPGGVLSIRLTPEGRVIMAGPVAESFAGEIHPSLLASA